MTEIGAVGRRGQIVSPPVEPLRELVRDLEANGVACALGGSGLLAALGLAREVRDWDLTTDAPPDLVRAALGEREHEWVGSDALHADQKFSLAGGAIELIVGFAFHTSGGVVRLPTIVAGGWNGVPVGSPEVWAAAYVLLDRVAKAEALFGHLESRGADARSLARLLGEAVPAELRRRLEALPLDPTSSIT